jgi:hypothetical protein
MAGTFAHIALVDLLCQDGDTLDGIATLTPTMKRALMQFNNFCELGAISPDAPYLKLLNKDAAAWANVMHYWKTADFIRRAIPYVNTLDFRTTDTQRCFAWLFGFTAHLVTDFTVHPIINRRVGPYEQNKLQHRLCELNEDVYIFNQLGFGDISTAEFLKSDSGGIGSCADQTDDDKLDPAVRKLWCRCLAGDPLADIKMKDGLPAPKKSPDPDTWFEDYVTMIDKFAEEGNRFPWLCREIVEAKGMVYPELNEVDQSFIQNLKLPDGTTANYDQVFERARQNVITTWRDLGNALDNGDASLFTLPNGDLDTGLADDTQQSIFWGTLA